MSQEQKGRWNATRREKRAETKFNNQPGVQALRAELAEVKTSAQFEKWQMFNQDWMSEMERIETSINFIWNVLQHS